MLLKKKSKYSVDSDWAVILERIENDFAKSRALNQLVQLFSLSLQEARDLIDNTPIILLDHLFPDVAERIKNRFSELNMNCSLTNEAFTKRKCFRAVWPEPPDPSRFLGAPAPALVTPETNTFSEKEPPAKEPSVYEVPLIYGTPTQEEERQLKELMTDLQKENEMLKLKLEHVERSREEIRNKYSESGMDNLRTERLRLEETLGKLRAENSMLKSKTEELEKNAKALRQVSETASFERAQFTELKAQLEHVRAEHNKSQLAARRAQSEAKQFHMEWNQTQKVLSETRVELEELKRMLGDAQTHSMQIKEETDRLRLEFEKRFQTQNGELEEWKRKANDWSRSSVQFKEEAERLRSEFEGRFRTLDAELEEWKRKANDWSASHFKVLKENEFLRAQQSEELESLRVRNQQLSVQLEQAQRQNREFVSQLEHQELIQKRMKLANELTAQEAQLKTLVQKQQTLESEIRLREEEMKKVLSDQELIEQDIIKSKQAQKYLVEQAKAKEKNKFSKQRSEGQDFPSQRGTDPAVPPID